MLKITKLSQVFCCAWDRHFNMSKIINFGKAKKAKEKTRKQKSASENRLKFGRTKAEKILEKAKFDMRDKKLSDHKMDD